MLWACILLPSLALDTALRGRESSDRPFALVTGSAQQRRLIAVDAHARAAGLAPGQRLAEAEAVCRNLLTAEYDPDCTRASLALIAAWAYRYSSEVLVDPPRAVILEVERSFGLFGAWSAIEARLRGELDALGFRHRIALAPTPRAARVLARTRDGTTVASRDDLPRALAPIPIARAGLPAEAAATLAGMGIRTLGAVLALPRAALQRRFGKALVEAIELLLGSRPDTLAAYRPPDRF
ncbi:MAG: Y-family DNA polymerase, partial [Rhodanobacteraceae bacterium]